jgi:signal transduction histidine kinase
VSEGNRATLLERYQRLAEISSDLASTLDLKTLLNRIGRAAADLSNAQAASILLYDESKRQLHFESTTNLDEPLMRGLIVPVDSSIAGWIVLNRNAVIIDDTQSDSRHYSEIAKFTNVTTTSMLGVPLIAKDKVIGVLEAINRIEGRFTEEDLNVLVALGAQAAVAIENARLFHQSDLIAELVHELRTPLSSLNTAAHLLTRLDLPTERRQQVVEAIQTETSRLIDMTSDFLDVARLESGRIQFNTEVFDPSLLLKECASLVGGKVDENELNLLLDIPDDLPEITADRDKIKQVILNLLSNAIKYNLPKGSITFSAAVEGNDLVIIVSDTGPGINEAEMEHLFDKFYRLGSTEPKVPGSGLGLAISKRIIELHDGRIEVWSEVNVGSSFRVYLPIVPFPQASVS